MAKESELLRFVKLCSHLARYEVPLYRSKFSKHTFTQPQHIVLSCLKVKFRLTYRDLIDQLEEMPRIREALGLKVVPHFTTVQKAFSRLSTLLWRVLLKASASLLEQGRIAVIDASGFERHYASHFYTRRTKLKISAIKTTLLGDVKSLAIIDLHLTTTRRHDTQVAPRLAMRNLDAFTVLIGDKGYDDRRFRFLLRREGKRPLIKHREFKFWDRSANARINSKLYAKRSLLETINSMIKRKYGSWVSSRAWHRQFREIVAKCVMHNLELALKAMTFIVAGGQIL